MDVIKKEEKIENCKMFFKELDKQVSNGNSVLIPITLQSLDTPLSHIIIFDGIQEEREREYILLRDPALGCVKIDIDNSHLLFAIRKENNEWVYDEKITAEVIPNNQHLKENMNPNRSP